MKQTDSVSVIQKNVAPRVNFTIASLDKIVCAPDQTRTYAHDARTPGLIFCRLRSGAGAFYLYRRVNGRPARIRIGGFPELTVDKARKQAATMNAQITTGVDPQEAKRQGRGEATLQALFDSYLEGYAKVRNRESSWRENERLFYRYLSGWKSRPLGSITKGIVMELHTKIKQNSGPYAANRLLALLSVMFNKRGEALGFTKNNPCRGVEKFPEQSRERYLQEDELPKFFQSLKDHPDANMADFFLLLLFTGARRGNVMAMKWADLNLPLAIWTLPATVTKNGKPQRIALTGPAVQILGERLKARGDAEFVFESRSKTGHVVFPYKQWAAVLEHAGIKDLRMHDLRRTLGSWQAAGGSSLQIIGKSLGHLNVNTTAVYSRLNLEPVRQSVEMAVSAMLAAGQVEPKKQLTGATNED